MMKEKIISLLFPPSSHDDPKYILYILILYDTGYHILYHIIHANTILFPPNSSLDSSDGKVELFLELLIAGIRRQLDQIKAGVGLWQSL